MDNHTEGSRRCGERRESALANERNVPREYGSRHRIVRRAGAIPHGAIGVVVKFRRVLLAQRPTHRRTETRPEIQGVGISENARRKVYPAAGLVGQGQSIQATPHINHDAERPVDVEPTQ